MLSVALPKKRDAFMALEERLRVGLVIVEGLPAVASIPPEIDFVNHAPRVTAPVLVLNGRDDALFPYKTSQLPMSRAFGSPDEDKCHVTFPSGHATYSWTDHLIRESLDWLDRYFGQPCPAK